MSFRVRPPLLERYVLRESILPFFLGFTLVTFLFVIDFLFDYLDLILSKGVPPLVVGELFLLALGWITALSVPCGVLVGALMTFGRMAQDNEVTAMRAMGANVGRILRGPLLGALGLATLLALFNNYILPETNHRFANLTLSIHRKSPAARIVPGIFIDAFDDYSLMVRDIDARTGEMRDITIYDTSGESVTTIIAREGHMEYLAGGSVLRLDLRDGEIHEVPGDPEEGKYRRGTFALNTLYLRNSGAVLERTDRTRRGDREMNIQSMRQAIAGLEAQKARRMESLETRIEDAGFSSFEEFTRTQDPPHGLSRLLAFLPGRGKEPAPPDSSVVPASVLRSIQVERAEVETLERRMDAYLVEINKKFSIPFACIVFVLVGGPLGIRTRKGGFANMAIAVGFFIVYYLFLIAGEQLAERRLASPALAMWLPNIIFGILGIYLTVSVVGWGPSRGMR